MNRAELFTITLTADATRAEVGIWCDKCKLPSVIRYPLAGLHGGGVVDFGYVESCVDCDDEEVKGEWA